MASFTGAIVTAIIQSSSVTTVLVVGFVVGAHRVRVVEWRVLEG